MTAGPDDEPLFRVIRGWPTDDELAALVVVLTALRGPAVSAEPRSTGWGAYWRGLQTAPPPGPGGWRASARNW